MRRGPQFPGTTRRDGEPLSDDTEKKGAFLRNSGRGEEKNRGRRPSAGLFPERPERESGQGGVSGPRIAATTGPGPVQAADDRASELLELLDLHALGIGAADAQADVGVSLENVEPSAQGRSHPIGFVSEAGNGPWLRAFPFLLGAGNMLGGLLLHFLGAIHCAREHLLPLRARAVGVIAAARDLEADGLRERRQRVEALRHGEAVARRLARLRRRDLLALHRLDLLWRQERTGIELPLRRGGKRRRGEEDRCDYGRISHFALL